MGAVELKFTGTFEKNHFLKDFHCPQCQQYLTDKDIENKNYQLWVSDYANEITKDFYGSSPVHGVSFWLKAVEHEDCPELEANNN